MGFTLDLTEDDAQSVERGIYIEPGWHLAELEDTWEDEKNSAQVFKFKIIGGPCTGMHQTSRLFDPANSKDAASQKTTAQKAKLWGRRLGVLPDEVLKTIVEPAWLDAIGRKVILHIEPQPKDPRYTEIVFDGIYPVEPTPHAKIPNLARQLFGLPLNPEEKAPVKGGRGTGGRKSAAAADGGGGTNGSHGAAATATAAPVATAVDVSSI